MGVLGTILAFQLCGLVIELGVALLPRRSIAPEIFSIILSVIYVTITSVGLHGTLHRKPDFLKGYAISMLVTLTISVVMAAMIAYLTSLGVLVFSLDRDPTFNQWDPTGTIGSISHVDRPTHSPSGHPNEDFDTRHDNDDEFFFLRTNLQVLIHSPADGTHAKRFQFLSILETHTLRNLLSGIIGLWVIPTLWTIVRTCFHLKCVLRCSFMLQSWRCLF